jgi:hypothetical protein
MKPYRCPTCRKPFITLMASSEFAEYSEPVVVEFLKRRPDSVLCNKCLFDLIQAEIEPVDRLSRSAPDSPS